MSLSVVHLVRAANGPGPLQAFLGAYRQKSAGVDHDLIMACKGYDTASLAGVSPLWAAENPRVIMLPDTGFDLGTYREACLQLTSDRVCFLNSFSRPVQSGWLSLLEQAAQKPGVGIVGATGSLQISPHVRTNAFCMDRVTYLDLVRAAPASKAQACALEAGSGSLTSRLRAAGLQARVVGIEGDRSVEASRDGRTFWWGNQESLLVADNRTEIYARGSPATRASLQRSAWRSVEASPNALAAPSGAASRGRAGAGPAPAQSQGCGRAGCARCGGRGRALIGRQGYRR